MMDDDNKNESPFTWTPTSVPVTWSSPEERRANRHKNKGKRRRNSPALPQNSVAPCSPIPQQSPTFSQSALPALQPGTQPIPSQSAYPPQNPNLGFQQSTLASQQVGYPTFSQSTLPVAHKESASQQGAYQQRVYSTSRQAYRQNSRSRRNTWIRRLSTLMIICGILALPVYFGVTFLYTWYQQNGLESQLKAKNPHIISQQASMGQDSFVLINALDDKLKEIKDQALALAELAAYEKELATFAKAAKDLQASIINKGGEPIGKIVIPSIGMDVILVEGVGTNDLKIAPGHWPETPLPGLGGNFVISGHRSTYGAPFFKLNDLQEGDEVNIILPYVIAKYVVTRVIIVNPNEVDTVAQRGIEEVSLVACHPIYSAKQRIVAQAELVSFKLISSEE